MPVISEWFQCTKMVVNDNFCSLQVAQFEGKRSEVHCRRIIYANNRAEPR